jgi:glycine/sarcosine N-methyltransferase
MLSSHSNRMDEQDTKEDKQDNNVKQFFSFLREFSKEAIIGVFLAAIIPYGLYQEGVRDVARDIIVGGIVFIIIFVLTILLQLISPIGLLKVMWYARGIGGMARKPLSRLIASDTKRLIDTLDNLDSDNGVEFDKERANDFYTYCFQGANKYSGTDTYVPSQFITNEMTKTYFRRHTDLQNKNKKGNHFPESKRFLIVSKDDLVYDYQVNGDDFIKCIKQHKENGIELYQIEKAFADQFRKQQQLLSPVVGLWPEKYALQFVLGNNNNRTRLSIGYPNKPRYSRCKSYFDKLKEKSAKIEYEEEKKQLKLGSELIDVEKPISTILNNPNLTSLWSDYVNYDKRLKAEREFLKENFKRFENVNKEKVNILDAAAGIGCETIFLSELGYNVTSNEMSEELQRIAQDKAEKNYVRDKIIWTKYDWREMAFKFNNEEFDVVLLLGNFLSLILSLKDRKRCLDQFIKILKPGGLLIADERNYPRIKKIMAEQGIEKLSEQGKKEIFYKNFYSANYIYCGTDVKGWPSELKKDGIVKFRYERDDAYNNLGEKNEVTLKMHMFKEDELKELLIDAGFNICKEYSDFVEKKYEGADFFIYVVEKPTRGQIWPDRRQQLSEYVYFMRSGLPGIINAIDFYLKSVYKFF